jgi:branched-chain amino acid transport system ATP-binding protein
VSLLAIDDLQVRYGQVTGTNGLSLEVNESETVALVGSNGAGKSSTMKAIMGLVPLAGGDIRWRGESLKGKKPSRLSAAECLRESQGRGLQSARRQLRTAA